MHTLCVCCEMICVCLVFLGSRFWCVVPVMFTYCMYHDMPTEKENRKTNRRVTTTVSFWFVSKVFTQNSHLAILQYYSCIIYRL